MNADNPTTNAPEEWRSLAPIGASAYEASSHGRIRSLKSYDQNGAPYVLAQALTRGRPNTRIVMDDGRPKTIFVARVVCRLWHGPRPGPGYVVCHGNDVASDNRPENLRWATYTANAHDRKLNGGDTAGLPRFERRGSLPVATVRAVRRAIDDGLEIAKIAAEFNLTPARVRNIAVGSAYRWVCDTTTEQEARRFADEEAIAEHRRRMSAARRPVALVALERSAPPREQRLRRNPHTPPASSPCTTSK